VRCSISAVAGDLFQAKILILSSSIEDRVAKPYSEIGRDLGYTDDMHLKVAFTDNQSNYVGRVNRNGSGRSKSGPRMGLNRAFRARAGLEAPAGRGSAGCVPG
jgi:hypothetical protein